MIETETENPFKHGLAARGLFIPGENRSVFYENYWDYMKHLDPDGPLEFELVEKMCVALWLKDRAIRMQSLAFEKAEPGEIPKDLKLFIRYQTTNEDLFFRALRTLQAIQKQRKAEAQYDSRQRFTPDLNNPIVKKRSTLIPWPEYENSNPAPVDSPSGLETLPDQSRLR